MAKDYTIELTDLADAEHNNIINQITHHGARVTPYIHFVESRNYRYYIEFDSDIDLGSIISLPKGCRYNVGRESGLLATKENTDKLTRARGVLFQIKRTKGNFDDVLGIVDAIKAGTLELEFVDFLSSEKVSVGNTLFSEEVGELRIIELESLICDDEVYAHRAYVECLITPWDTVEHKLVNK